MFYQQQCLLHNQLWGPALELGNSIAEEKHEAGGSLIYCAVIQFEPQFEARKSMHGTCQLKRMACECSTTFRRHTASLLHARSALSCSAPQRWPKWPGGRLSCSIQYMYGAMARPHEKTRSWGSFVESVARRLCSLQPQVCCDEGIQVPVQHSLEIRSFMACTRVCHR